MEGGGICLVHKHPRVGVRRPFVEAESRFVLRGALFSFLFCPNATQRRGGRSQEGMGIRVIVRRGGKCVRAKKHALTK